MKQLKKIGLLLVLPALLLIFILFTDPYKLPLALIVVPFVLFAAIIYRFSRLIFQKLHMGRSRAKLIAITMTGVLLLLALLQSIHQLSVKDFLILLALVVGLTFYLRRLDI